jgi:dihydrofolate synthase/folylpolyglutamate synthase
MAQIDQKHAILEHLISTSNFDNTSESVIQTINALQIKPNYPIILVGGTNGKGSTCAYLSTILSIAGYNVGTFTSPHVFEYNERITVNNQAINDEDLISALQQVINASSSNLGLFKTFTLASHLIFAKHQIEIAVVEVGIGGKNDVTNLFEPDISIISTVGLDHCELLGADIEAIGLQKAHIYRADKPALFGSSNIPQTVSNYAEQINADFMRLNHEFSYKKSAQSWDFSCEEQKLYTLPYPSLRGEEQVQNAALALAALYKLRDKFPLTSSQIKNGLLQTKLFGRFQVLPGTPQIVLDTAHNPQAIESLRQNMLKLHFARRNFAVFGIADDKDWVQIIASCGKDFDVWYLAPINSGRSASVEKLAQKLEHQGINNKNIIINSDIELATEKCYQQLTSEDRMVCFGSFLVVESAYRAIQKVRR